MTPERWREVTAIFHAALARDAGERDAFVSERCGVDADLRREVGAMLAGHAEADAFGQTPLFAAARVVDHLAAAAADDSTDTLSSFAPLDGQSVATGELLADRYRIIRLIGRGGMGAVYEARDEVIDAVIALKIVHPQRAPVDALAARWRREVLLARKISHTGVCRVHDVAIHRQDDRTWLLLTMERVNGESLRERVRRGDISLDEALSVAGQVASALDAAHARGVLHRDVKPDNILLEPREAGGVRAVLTDFGIARDVTGTTALTDSGHVVGTQGYLAPELLRGELASTRSDVYAFALVVRTMLGGAMSSLAPRVETVFARALNPEPASRFDSATQFIDALALAVPSTSSSARAMRVRRRRWLGAIATAAALAAATAAVWFSRATATIPPASHVLLTDLVNGTSDAELDGAGEILRSQLAQSTHFELLEPERVQAALTRMGRRDAGTRSPDVAREIALREGVPVVVYAALTRLGSDYTLTVKLEHVGPRPSFARRSWTRTFDAPTKAGLFETVHGAAVWIRHRAGELQDALDQQDRAASETTTTSWEALRLFAQAADLQAAGRVHDATLVLEQAIRIDPEFAMAYTRLGDYLISLRRDKDGFAAWRQAIAAAERRQLTSRETLRIRAQYLDDTGDLAGAEKAYRTYAIHYPNDFHAAFYLGASLKELNRTEEAVPWLERAANLRPRSIVGAVHLAGAYLDLGRASDAARAIDHVQAIGASEWSTWLRALSLFVAVRPDDALAALEPLRGSPDPEWRSRAHLIRASWLSEVGRDGEAGTELRRGIDHDTTHGLRGRLADKWLHLAELQRRVNDPAATSVHRALETASNARRLQSAVRVLVRAGHRADAERLIASFDQLPAVPLTAVARDRALAELALAAGDLRGSVSAFERTLASSRRWENRLPFAEALARAGDLARAEQVVQATVDHPAVLYGGAEAQGPGLWRQAVMQLAHIVERRDPSAAAEIVRRFAPLVPRSAATAR